MDTDTLLERFNVCCRHVKAIQYVDRDVYRDCIKMVQATQHLFDDVSRASVECNRLKRPTPVYNEALKKASDGVQNLERYIMIANLMV